MKLCEYDDDFVVYQAYSAISHIKYDLADRDDFFDKTDNTSKDFFIRTFKILDYLGIKYDELKDIAFGNAYKYIHECDIIINRIKEKYHNIIYNIEQNNIIPLSAIDIDLTGELGESNVPIENLQ